jgi:tetratricopeptide (TPR) repeat protein
MTEDGKQGAAASAVEFSEQEKEKARAWFRKAAECRERRDYDYAIECFITGLSLWPEAVEDGHMPLRSLAIQRQQAGGSKPGALEGLFKRRISGKDPKQCLLNAEYLLAKDPTNATYLDAVLKNAVRAGYLRTVRWVAPLVFDSIRREKKVNRNRVLAFRNALVEAAEMAEGRGEASAACWLLEQALNAHDYLMARCPGDETLRNDQRDLSGKLAIVKGKYQEAESFRESLRDAEHQKILHDTEKIKQADTSYEALLVAARKEYEENPHAPQKLFALVDLLLRRESPETENEAIDLLLKAHRQTRNYMFKSRADDIRLRQLARRTRELEELVRSGGSEENRQQLQLARRQQLQAELEIYRERVANYPTDLRLKYRLGTVLFKARQFDEAIPVLQAAQGDPRSRHPAQLLIGRSFFEKHNYAQAADVLKELLESEDLGEELGKEALYWLGRSLEAAGRIEEARAAYGKLLRQDYNYADGDARKRLEALTPSA